MSLTGSYLDRAGFEARTIAPAYLVEGSWIDPTGAFTDALLIARRTAFFAFIESQLIIQTSKINSRLRKRYAVPFADPAPEIVCGWLVALVTPMVYRRRGVDPSDEQITTLDAMAQVALDEIKEAADENEGLFDLPLKQTDESSALTNGPLAYTETSPYAWTGIQQENAEVEDENT